MRAPMKSASAALRKAILSLLLVGWTLISLYPFLWMLSSTFRPETEIGRLNPIPGRWTLENYRLVFTKIPIGRAFANSLFVSLTVTAGVLILTSMIGYALSRLRFRGRDGLFAVILFTMTLPFQITIIPMYVLMVKFGWNDSYYALIVPYLVNAFAIVVFRQYFKTVPEELLDAARIDGCSDFGILFRIMWPLSVPALITVAIITFMNIWNEVLWPIIVIRKWELMTMPQLVALFAVGGKAEGLLGVRLAAAALLALPIVVAYAIFQRHFIASMATTGLKS